MKEARLTERTVKRFESYLLEEERSRGTVERYGRALRQFIRFLEGRRISRREICAWRESLMVSHAPATVNANLAAVNGILTYMGREDCRVKQLKIQNQTFCDRERELTEREYHALVNAANKRGDERMALVLQTICATGIRVSELKFITIDAAETGSALIRNKGKIRRILLPNKLCRVLLRHARQVGRRNGPIFITRNGRPLDRFWIWKAMKTLCADAGVEPQKVFPHNLRHLFARVFYRAQKDLSRLADILGHKNVSTTRIYMMESGEEHVKMLDKMKLVLASG